MKFCYRSFLVIVFLLLVGCASYKPPQPAPLTQFKSTLRIEKQWSNTVGKGTNTAYLTLTPVISNGKIFADSNDGVVAAYGTQTGKNIWKANTGLTLTSGLGAGGNKVFVGTNQAQLVAIKQTNGMPGWWKPLPSELLATPTVAKNIVLVKDESGAINAFHTNGKLLWTYVHNEPSLILRGSSSLKVSGNYVVAGFASGELVVLNLRSGQVVWNKYIAEGHGISDVERMVDIDAEPQVVNGVIYAVSYKGKIAAVRLRDGRILWQHKMSSYSGLAVAHGNVYVTDDKGYVWDFDAKTGAGIWRVEALANRNLTAPAVIGKSVVVGDAEGYLHFLARNDGHFVGRVRVTSSPIIATPIVVGDSVYAYAANGKLAKYIVK